MPVRAATARAAPIAVRVKPRGVPHVGRATMSIRKTIQALVLTALLALVSAIYFFDKLSPDHELDKTLKEMGFLPVNPPSNLLGIGSLFHVDPKVKFFRTVCRADPAYIETVVIDPPGIKMLADVLERGTFALDPEARPERH